MKRLFASSAVVLTATLVATPLHAANEIRIIRGALVQRLNSDGDLTVDGTSGVRIDAVLDPHFNSINWDVCDRGCQPGAVIDIGAAYNAPFPPLRGSGQLTIRGQTYGLFDDAVADFEFFGTLVLPALTEQTPEPVEQSVPFTFSGSLQVPNQREPGTFDVFELRGSGVATATLERFPFVPGLWVVTNVRYDFVPRGDVIPR